MKCVSRGEAGAANMTKPFAGEAVGAKGPYAVVLDIICGVYGNTEKVELFER